MKGRYVVLIAGCFTASIICCQRAGTVRSCSEGLRQDHIRTTALHPQHPSSVMAKSGASDRDSSPAEVVVTMTYDLQFDPSTVMIMTGDRVKWINTSSIGHTVTNDPELAENPKNGLLPKGAKPFNSGTIEPGESHIRTFSVPGTYRYFCIPHEKAKMIGEVIVRSRN